MLLFSLGLMVLVIGSLILFITGKNAKIVHIAGVVFSVAGGGLLLVSSVLGIFGQIPESTLIVPWNLPLGRIVFGLTPLSSFFVFIISLITIIASFYAPAYLRHYGEDSMRVKGHWFFYLILVASMAAVVTSQNAICFLIAWEVMSLSSFFLVVFQSEVEKTRNAGWIYLVSTHIGTAFLLVMFSILAKECGSYDFEAFRLHASQLSPETSSLIFILALIGFGTKAGFLPMHIWLPEAHPAAPSHVSAVMSGVMIKTGIYGIIATLAFIGIVQEWWGWTLLIAGIVSGTAGILMAITQHDLKRLLAYSSVENIGIISIALGIGIIGKSAGSTPLMTLGFLGGLLHILNHSLFKSLLFLGAGSIQTAAETLELDKMGGLLKKMPFTGTAFFIGAAAITGLPPLNGFISEFLIYLGAFNSYQPMQMNNILLSVAVAGGLSLIGGLAIFCFTKVFGTAFQGTARSREASEAKENSPLMIVPMLVLAALCSAIGFFPREAATAVSSVIGNITGSPVVQADLDKLLVPLGQIQTISFVLVALVLGLMLIKKLLLSKSRIARAETWGCGYGHPSEKMQYTASSYAQPVTSVASSILRTKSTGAVSNEIFPEKTGFKTHTSDSIMEKFFKPVFRFLEKQLSRIRIIQQGNLNMYVLYILVSLIVLLIWCLGV